jgi:hypothetical protein
VRLADAPYLLPVISKIDRDDFMIAYRRHDAWLGQHAPAAPHRFAIPLDRWLASPRLRTLCREQENQLFDEFAGEAARLGNS